MTDADMLGPAALIAGGEANHIQGRTAAAEGGGTPQPIVGRVATRLVSRLLAAWTEQDYAGRTSILADCCSPTVVYANPLKHVTGIEAVSALLGEILLQFPGVRPVRVGDLDVHNRYARFHWSMRDSRGYDLLSGVDMVAFTAKHDSIRSVVSFFNSPGPRVTYTYGHHIQ